MSKERPSATGELELLPCPFCGGSARTLESAPDERHAGPDMDDTPFAYAVFCADNGGDCGAGPTGRTAAEAAAMWNRRAARSETATAIPSGIVKNMLAGQRLAVIDECALVCDGMSGIQFALIGKAATEEVKHKHGAKTAMAMECAAAIRSLKSAAPQVDAGYPGKGDYSQSGSEPAVSAPVTETPTLNAMGANMFFGARGITGCLAGLTIHVDEGIPDDVIEIRDGVDGRVIGRIINVGR